LHARLVLVPLPHLLVHEILLRVLPALLLFLGARSLTPWGRLFTSAEQALQPHLQARSIRPRAHEQNACGGAGRGAVVETGGFEWEESAPEDARPQEDGWENEGGALDREPKQAPKKGANDSEHD
jgi:hypothetical protein